MGVFLFLSFPKFNERRKNMVHTATLTHWINRQLYEEFKHAPGTQFYQQETKLCNLSLRDNGITLWAYQLEPLGAYILVMRINFIRLVEKQDRVAVMAEADVTRIEKKFNELMDELMLGLPHFEEWKVNRIDYCVNVHTPYVAEYIELLKDSNIPPSMKRLTDENRNQIWKNGSFYLISKARRKKPKKTGSKTINFYDKHKELQNQLERQEPGITADIVEQGRNILRLEVQCFKPMVEYLKVKGGFSAKYIKYYLNAEYGYNLIERAIVLSCGRADFHRRAVAHEMIDVLKAQTKTKALLHELIDDVSRASLHKVKQRYLKAGKLTATQFRYYIKLLERNNINPVTISKNTSLPGKTYREGLRSLWELFYEAYTAEPLFGADPGDTADTFDIDSFIKDELILQEEEV